MDWHYSESGQQFGPVSEDELLRLAQTGVVKPESMVWQSGMTEWKPFRDAGPGAPPPLPPQSTATRFCTMCGNQFSSADLAFFGESAICAGCKPAWVQRVRQGMTSAVTSPFRYAGFWIRVGAQIIDGLITSTVLGAIFMIFFGAAFFDAIKQIVQAGSEGRPADPTAMIPMMASIGIFQLVAFLGSAIYSIWFLVKFGATPGKMAVGIKVVRPDGGPLSVGQAIGRYFAHILSGLILYIGYMMAGWDDEKRALHDRLAGTRVIRIR